MNARWLTPAELSAIAHIADRGGLSSTQEKALYDRVLYRRFKKKVGRWLRPRISGIYRIAIDKWPQLERDPEIARRAESKPYCVTASIKIEGGAVAIPADRAELERAYVAAVREIALLKAKLTAKERRDEEINKRKGRRGSW